MRGTLSMASTVAFFAASVCMSSGFCAGQMNETSVWPSRMSSTSSRARRAHLEDDVGARPERGCVVGDLRARGAVDFVAEVGGVAGAGLHDDPEAELHELFDDFGHRGDAFLARRRLFGHPYDLRHAFPLCLDVWTLANRLIDSARRALSRVRARGGRYNSACRRSKYCPISSSIRSPPAKSSIVRLRR